MLFITNPAIKQVTYDNQAAYLTLGARKKAFTFAGRSCRLCMQEVRPDFIAALLRGGGAPVGDRQQDYAWTILMRLISWARDCELTTYRPPSRMKRTYKSDRSDKIWLLDQIAAFRPTAG